MIMDVIMDLIEIVILALGCYKLFEILVKWLDSLVEKYN